MMKILIYLLLVVNFTANAQDTVTIKHQRFSTTFDRTLRYPLMVRWTVSRQDICPPHTPRRVERSNSMFKPDPMLPAYTRLRTIYLNNPGHYQRGHNMNAADNSCDLEQMKECHYFSNITPQTSELNEHVWGDLEDQTRHLAQLYGTVEVWCGSYGNGGSMGAVSVPAFCWKIIRYHGVTEAYIMPNDHIVDRHPYDYYQTTVAKVREATHLSLPGI